MKCVTLTLAISLFPTIGFSAEIDLLDSAPEQLSYCGSMYSPPFADPEDGVRTRTCDANGVRNYTPRHRGLGHEALDLESEACFVPDSAYRLLDEVVDEVSGHLGPPTPGKDPASVADRARAIGRTTLDVLAEKGFGLYIPTETLGDMLVARSAPGEQPRYTMDCDTSSLVVLTVADVLGAKASLVEITLSGGSGHNFVRWQTGEGQTLDWDTNGRADCLAPENNPSFQGIAMSHDQTISYILSIRAQKWLRRGQIPESLADNREAIMKFPEHPHAYNNFAWTVATREFDGRARIVPEAMRYADRLMEIQRVPNMIDTAACVAALSGDFSKAIQFEEEALLGEPNSRDFQDRLAGFKAMPPRDCTGAT